MAQIQTLKSPTGTTIYPLTSSEAVIDPQGRDLETRLASEREQTANTLKDYATKNALTEGLADKQDALTDSEDVTVGADSSLSLTDKAKMRLFIDRWNAMCISDQNKVLGTYNGSTGYFELNGYTDITYSEAINIIEYALQRKNDYVNGLCGLKARTNLCKTHSSYSDTYSLYQVCRWNSQIEKVVLSANTAQGIWAYNVGGAFGSCPNLREIEPYIDISSVTETNPALAFWNFLTGSKKLQTIKLSGLKISISFGEQPLLSRESLEFIVARRGNVSKPITITVHPDVYAKLTGDTTNEAAAALTAEELAAWQQILTDAVAKNISFATT